MIGNYVAICSRPIYSVSTSVSVTGYARESRRESRVRDGLETFGRSALERRLRREEADRRARSDAASRRRSAPRSGAPVPGARLPTHDNAIAARCAARRTA